MLFFVYDSKNGTLLNMTQRFELVFECDSKYFFQKKKLSIEHFESMTPRIEPDFEKLWLKELNPSFQHDSKNWTLLFNMTHRIEPFFFKMSQRIEPFLLNTTQRIEPFFFFSNSKNWNFWMTLRTEFFQMWLKKIDFFFQKKKLLEELNP